MSLRSDSENFALIRVIGVGGGGSNAVNRMIRAEMMGVEFIACNTDSQALLQSDAPHKIRIGDKVTRGLGAGGDSTVGQRSAEEDSEKIAEALRGVGHGVHHRRSRWRHGLRGRPGRRADRQGGRRPHDRRRHQAVLVRGTEAQARRREVRRGAQGPGRRAHHHPERPAQGRRPEEHEHPRCLPRRGRRAAPGRPGDQRHHHGPRAHQPGLRRRPRDHEGRGLRAHGHRPGLGREPRRRRRPPGHREPAARARHQRRPGHPLEHHGVLEPLAVRGPGGGRGHQGRRRPRGEHHLRHELQRAPRRRGHGHGHRDRLRRQQEAAARRARGDRGHGHGGDEPPARLPERARAPARGVPSTSAICRTATTPPRSSARRRGWSAPWASPSRRSARPPTTRTTSRSRASSAASKRRWSSHRIHDSSSRSPRARASVLARIADACAAAGSRPGVRSRSSPCPRRSMRRGCGPPSRPASTSSGRTGSRRPRARRPPSRAPAGTSSARCNRTRPGARSSSSRSSRRSIRSTWRAGSTGSRRRSGPGARVPVLLQVNVDLDPAKHGFSPAAVDAGPRRAPGPAGARRPGAHDRRPPRARPGGRSGDVP